MTFTKKHSIFGSICFVILALVASFLIQIGSAIFVVIFLLFSDVSSLDDIYQLIDTISEGDVVAWAQFGFDLLLALVFYWWYRMVFVKAKQGQAVGAEQGYTAAGLTDTAAGLTDAGVGRTEGTVGGTGAAASMGQSYPVAGATVARPGVGHSGGYETVASYPTYADLGRVASPGVGHSGGYPVAGATVGVPGVGQGWGYPVSGVGFESAVVKTEPKVKLRIRWWRLFLIGLWLNMMSYGIVGLLFAVYPELSQEGDLFEFTDLSNFGIVLLLICIVILAPIAEELMFRGVIHGYLMRIVDATQHRRIALFVVVVIQGILFGIFHLNLIQASYAIFIGMILGLIRYHSRSVKPCIFVHLVVNFLSTFFGNAFSSYEILINALIFTVVGVVLAYVTLFHWRGEKTKPLEVEESQTMFSQGIGYPGFGQGARYAKWPSYSQPVGSTWSAQQF